MRLWPSAKPTGDDIAIDSYWDNVVQLQPNDPVPIPPQPTELTSLIQQLAAEQHVRRTQASTSDPMLQSILAAQQETKRMNYALPVGGNRMVAPIKLEESRREKWTGMAMIAAVFALAIGMVALSAWRTDDHDGPNHSGLFAASPETSPAPDELENRGATLVWRTATGSDSMLYPTDIAIGPDGNIWVVDAGHNQIRVYSADGDLLKTWGGPGTGPGEFNFLQEQNKQDTSLGAIAFGPDGSIYVVDAGNFRVQKFDSDTQFLLQFGSLGGGVGQFVNPCAIAVTSDGTVIVQDFGRDLIQAFDPDGTFLYRVGKRGDGAGEFGDTGWLSADQNDTLWSADWGNNRVMNLATDGAFVGGWGVKGTGPGQFSEVIDATSDGNGHVFTSEVANRRVQVFDTSGHVMSVISDSLDSTFMVPFGVAVDDSGALYVADFGRGIVVKFALDFSQMVPAETVQGTIDAGYAGSTSIVGDTGGEATFRWTTADAGVTNGMGASITVAPDGSIWLADATSDSFRIYSPDGAFIEEWGGSGDGPGEFDFVANRYATDPYQFSGQVLFAADGSLFVTDPGNGRIQMFAADRSYIGMFDLESDPDAAIGSIGRIFDLGDGTIGVEDYPDRFGGRPYMAVFSSDGSFVERRHLYGTLLLAIDGEEGYWSLHEEDEGKNLPRKYSWTGEVLLDLEQVEVDGNFMGIGSDLAFGDDGTIYTADQWNGTISAFDQDGRYLMSWNGEDSTVGMFWSPNSVEIGPDGSIFVLDATSSNVSSYQVTLPGPE